MRRPVGHAHGSVRTLHDQVATRIVMSSSPDEAHRVDLESLPPLYHDRAFWGMSITQFLGAFNDSVFKQVVLLLCLSVVVVEGQVPSDKQFLAQAVFAIPFILFSGFAGYCSDRVTKRYLIIGCKIAEIFVMLAAVFTFWISPSPEVGTFVRHIGSTTLESEVYIVNGMPWLLLLVLCLMGTQSAWFGPAKYGILPEMVRGSDLPRFNGIIQMTTFLALILGIWIGGWLIDQFHDSLSTAALGCVAIAIVGTATSLLVRKTPVAQREGRLRSSDFAAGAETWRFLKSDRSLRTALLVYSAFWFVAAILPMTINWLGVYQFRKNYETTSLLLASSSVGIAVGFVVAGRMSKQRIRFSLVRIGSWGLIACLILISIPRGLPDAPPDGAGTDDAAMSDSDDDQKGMQEIDGKKVITERLSASTWPHLLGYGGSQCILILMGFFTGLFALPVQVFLQSKPPSHLKGRVIGSMNLINWIAIILAAVFFFACDAALANLGLPKYFVFGLASLVLLPIAIFYRPADVEL